MNIERQFNVQYPCLSDDETYDMYILSYIVVNTSSQLK